MTADLTEGPILTRREGDILFVTLNRPESLNAMDNALVNGLRDLFTGLYWRRDVRVVVLTGAGRAFCAGLDLRNWNTGESRSSTGEGLDGQRRIAEIVIAMRRCPQPIIALVNGPASGGGFAVALASDVRILTPTAKMNAAFIRIGLSACDIGVSYFLPRMVGSSVAAEYMLTGRFFTPDRAQQLGLASAVVDPGDLAAEGRALAEEMLHASPLGLRLTKDALNHSIDAGGLEAVIAMEDRNQVLTARDENFAEGVAAFLEKRKPSYR
ncbi:enoyl-CoA hydratase/isomerase family protein [Sandaracinobacter sp.]|uniref:enoyl-CoA hydratase/isomerase family protein n=1 Tax=Sandaracinobacter sp. TaxID=2487581 RepID=UPI0035B3534A